MNTTHDKFNEMPTAADCTRALDEANRSLDYAQRTETELALYRLVTDLRETERRAGRLRPGPMKVEAMREADRASAALCAAIAKAVRS